VTVTLTPDEFTAITRVNDANNDDTAAPPGEAFAIAMSSRIEVSKYMAPKPVIATRAYREDGEFITSFDQLRPALSSQCDAALDGDGTEMTIAGACTGSGDDATSLRRVYLVAEGLEFMWPFVEYGHRQVVSPNVVPPNSDGPVVLESMAELPRVFRVYNMATEEEAKAVIETALNATGETALKRSTVGSGKDADGNDIAHEDHGRTSDNSWDYESPAAKTMMTRSFQLTNIEEDSGKRDGLQVVRYTQGQGYNTHPDFFTQKDDDDGFDFNPYSGGSNRYATVFMYLNDPEEGGYTVFPRAPDPGPVRVMPPEAEGMFEMGTWEHTVNNDCYTKLAVPPKLGTAALFYSATPDGRIDPQSHHAACPLIKGTKWGANIWIWNKQRYGELRTGEKRTVNIVNKAGETVYISWEGKDNGSIEPNESLILNTFEYHRFKASFGSHKEKQIALFTVQSKPDHQVWEIKQPRRQEQSTSLQLIAKNLLDVNVEIFWEGHSMGVVIPDESQALNSFEGHTFKANLAGGSGTVSTYTVKNAPALQNWMIT
jgi:prolyl 4-hydroxylase